MTSSATSSGEDASFEEVLRKTLHVSKWTPGLTLLYFHTPHEDVNKDKLAGMAAASFRQCKTFHDKKVVDWLALFHPVEIDMGKSDVKTAEMLGYKDGAIFTVVDQDMHVLASCKPVEKDGVVAFLKTTLQGDKKSWDCVQKQIDDQKAALEKARDFAKHDKWKEAAEEYRQVLNSPCHVADFWEAAAKEADAAIRKAEQKKS